MSRCAPLWRAIIVAIIITALPSPASAYRIDWPGPLRRCRFLGDMKVAVYYAVPEQTDGNPFVTADGTDVRILSDTTCAVSQEQFVWNGGTVRFGDTLRVYHGSAIVPRSCTVRDAMAAKVWKRGLGEWVPLTGYVDIMTPVGVMGFWKGVPVFRCLGR